MLFQWILDLVVSGEWLFRSSKPYVGEGLCRCPSSLLSSQCDLQTPAGSGSSKEEDDRFGL